MNHVERLYYTTPGLTAVEARVLSVEGSSANPILMLDPCLFYPEGGGQPCDLGTIEGVPLAAVESVAGRILHRLAAPLPGGRELGPGDRVTCILDAVRRRDHAEQHTGQHLLSAIAYRRLGSATRGFHLGLERSTVDLAFELPAEEAIRLLEEAVEEEIVRDRPLIVHVSPPEDLSRLDLRKMPPHGEDEIRVVEIEGLDASPCCGTHLGRTKELRLVRVLAAERYKGMTRVTFVAGARAAREARMTAFLAREAARILGASVSGLPDESARLAGRLKEAEGRALALFRERAALEAALALARRDGGDERGPLVFRFDDRGADAAFEAVRAAQALGASAVAASLPALTACAVLEGGSSLRGDIASVLGPLVAAHGGRGGGRGVFRASFPDKAALEAFLADCTALFTGHELDN